MKKSCQIDVGKTKTGKNLEFCESEIAVKKETKKMSSSMPQQKSFSVDELNQLHLRRGLIRDCNNRLLGMYVH